MITWRCDSCGHRLTTEDDVVMVECKYCIEAMEKESEDDD